LNLRSPSVSNIVVIDSNFVLLPFQFKIDYLKEIVLNLEGKTKFILFKQVLDELEAKKIRENKAIKFQKHFESGLSYLDKNKGKFNIVYLDDVKDKSETTDEFLVRSCINLKSENSRVFLASNDALLRKKARESQIGRIFLRQKKYLSFDRS
jgi:rRNA-processing protein FCF1